MKKTMKSPLFLATNETFWSLTCILGVIGIPGMILGDQLAKTYGVVSAIISICSGNLILWILGLGIISMAQGKSNAIDNVRKHFGKWSALLASLLFTLAFLTWYTLQLSSAASRTTILLQFHEEWQVGLILGIITAILSFGGFKMVKWVTLLSLPTLALIAIYYISIHNNSIQYVGNSQFSYLAILPIVMAFLSGAVNLPTFFRHSRSKTDSIVAFSLIMIFHIFFQIFTIFCGSDLFSINTAINLENKDALLNIILSVSFSIITFICVNLTNIYFVSACWEMIFPRDHGAKKYVIFAIIGTCTYTYLKISNKIDSISIAEYAIMYSMTILVLSLLINFLISIAVKHRLRYLSKFLGSISWIIGSAVTIITLAKKPTEPNAALISGCISTTLFAMATVFVEETIWAIKNIRPRKNN